MKQKGLNSVLCDDLDGRVGAGGVGGIYVYRQLIQFIVQQR